MFKLGEASLDEISQGVDVAVDHRLDLSVPLGRNNRHYAPCLQVLEDGVGVVALIGDHHFRLGAKLVHDRGVAFDVGHLAAGQSDGDRQA